MKQLIHIYKENKKDRSIIFESNPIEAYFTNFYLSMPQFINEIVREAYKSKKSKNPEDYRKDVLEARFVDQYSKIINNNIEYYAEIENKYKSTLLKAKSDIFKSDNLFDKLDDAIRTALSNCIDFKELKYKLPHKENIVEFLKACRQLYGNMDPYTLGDTAYYTAKWIQKVYANIDPSLCSNPNTTLYLYSKTYGGCGKTTFMDRLMHFAETYGLPHYDNCNVKSKWTGTYYSNHLIGRVEEFSPFKTNEDDNTFNNIIDNQEYISEQKFKPSLKLKSNISLAITSNFMPYDANDGRYGICRWSDCNDLRNKTLSDQEKQYLATDHYQDYEYWDKVFYKLFTSAPFNISRDFFKNYDDTKYVSDKYYDIIEEIREAKNELTLDGTPTQIAKSLWQWKVNNNYHYGETEKYLKQSIRQLCSYLVKNSFLKPINNQRHYEKATFNIQQICDCPTSDIALVTLPEDPIIATYQAWTDLISQFENNNKPTGTDPEDYDTSDEYATDDAKNFRMPVNAVVKNSNGEVYFKTPTFEVTDQEYLCAAEFTEEYMKEIVDSGDTIHRKQEFMRPVCFVYESDSLPLQAQENKVDEVLKQYSNNIFSVTYSGSKSYHTLVYIKPEDRDIVKQDYKFFWNKVAEKVFGLDYVQYLDKQCANITRLTRRPGAVRSNGKKQTCKYMNRDVVGIDLTDIKQEYLAYETRKKHEQAMKYAEMQANKKRYEDRPEQDPMNVLRNVVNKTHNASGQLALEIIESGQAESGSNMIGALGYLKALMNLGFPFEDLHRQLYDICHSQHPSNIRGNYEHYL